MVALRTAECYTRLHLSLHFTSVSTNNYLIHAYTSHSNSPQLVRYVRPFTQGIYFFVIRQYLTYQYHLFISITYLLASIVILPSPSRHNLTVAILLTLCQPNAPFPVFLNNAHPTTIVRVPLFLNTGIRATVL